MRFSPAKPPPISSSMISPPLIVLYRRWLVHNIATYYGLRTWSVTVGDPARREAYIGIKETKRTGLIRTPVSTLPRPLWGLV